MSRSISRSKCRRARCLLCKPWRLTGELPFADVKRMKPPGDGNAASARPHRDRRRVDPPALLFLTLALLENER